MLCLAAKFGTSHACAHESDGMQGEHGTGRNMAPFVEMEWGRKAYGLMWDLKELFDPDYVLNPGVVLNQVGGLSCWIL